MKIGGIDPKTLPCETVLVLPRGREQIVFRASGVRSMDDFHKFCPEPVPPNKLTKDGPVADTEDEGYRAALSGYYKRHNSYLLIHSLAPSQIEWDTVQIDNPSTWNNWVEDLTNAGLNNVECNLVMNLVMEANSLDEKKLERAREAFLRGTPAK